MYKKSQTRIESENESSRAELSNPALHDIIATNHVVYPKKPHEERLSRACKALIIMIILLLVSIGIIILTLVLAHSRNTLMAIVARSAEENFYSPSNHTRLRLLNQRNSTTVADESIKNENWPKTMATVSLTSDNLPTLTTPNVHISSSSVMRTEQQDEYTSPTSTAQSPTMKSYPSLNTIAYEQSTISTTTTTATVSDQQSTFTTDTEDDTTSEIMMMMTSEDPFVTTMKSPNDVQTSEDPFVTTMKSQNDVQTSADNSVTTIVESTFSSIDDETTTASMFEESSFTTFIGNHFNIQTSTVMIKNKQTTKVRKNFMNEEDVMDDIVF